VDLLFGDGIALAFWLNGTDSAGCCVFKGGPFTESRYFGEGIGIAVRRGNDTLRLALNWGLFRLWEKGQFTDLCCATSRSARSDVSDGTTGMRSIRAAAINAALVIGSLTVFLLICEFIVFRFILLASDVPANDFVNDLVRYRPNQIGIWRVRNEIAAPYAINAQGWNSGAGDYVLERKPGIAAWR